MDKTVYTSLVLGSTGLVGDMLTHNLLESDCYSTVYAISRSPLKYTHPKLINIIADYQSIDQQIIQLKVDHFYCCIGSTRKRTPQLERYYEIDHDYPLKVCKILKNNVLSKTCIVSCIGANVYSTGFYLKMKGELERDIIELAIPDTFILRPSLLLGKRDEIRGLELFSSYIMGIANLFLIGSLKNYRSIKASDVASAMQKIVTSSLKGLHIIQSEKIKKLA
jgi:uncharacterized protein YbjT (DUF2867 family)